MSWQNMKNDQSKQQYTKNNTENGSPITPQNKLKVIPGGVEE